MSRAVEWSAAALDDLRRMHWRTASFLDEALQRFATSGEGTLRAVMVEGTRELRLYVPPYFAWISVTPDRVIVWRVIRYNR